MSGFIDLTGHRYGRLTVLGPAERKSYWRCRCDCGVEREAGRVNLRSGGTQSCGCLQKERARDTQTTHGLSASAESGIRSSMISRCHNPNVKSYRAYGARGITVCDRWRESFENFFEDMGPRPSADHSIDRVDNDKGYSPDNCRWATREEQARNKRVNVFVKYKGQRMVLEDALRLSVVGRGAAERRMQNGWSIEDAIDRPFGSRNPLSPRPVRR